MVAGSHHLTRSRPRFADLRTCSSRRGEQPAPLMLALNHPTHFEIDDPAVNALFLDRNRSGGHEPGQVAAGRGMVAIALEVILTSR